MQAVKQIILQCLPKNSALQHSPLYWWLLHCVMHCCLQIGNLLQLLWIWSMACTPIPKSSECFDHHNRWSMGIVAVYVACPIHRHYIMKLVNWNASYSVTMFHAYATSTKTGRKPLKQRFIQCESASDTTSCLYNLRLISFVNRILCKLSVRKLQLAENQFLCILRMFSCDHRRRCIYLTKWE